MITQRLLLGRQPILDREGRMFAFELLFRGGGADTARASDEVFATSQVLHYAFGELGVDAALGPYQGFVNCSARMLLASDAIDMLPPERVVLEILETVEPTPEILERVGELRRAGFKLALDDYTGEVERFAALLPAMDFIKVDLTQVPIDRLPELVHVLRGHPAQLVAEKVETREQAQRCTALGFDLFQGYFFARPTVLAGRKLSLSQLALLRLLALLLQDADTAAVVDQFKHQPGLAVNLLRIANSASVSPGTRVTSLTQAVVVLGRRQLQRWVQLLLYTDPAKGEIANPLLQLAATRGRLMESLARTLWPAETERAERAFMAGMVSLMPAMFGVELPEILRSLPLPGEVSAAVTSYQGALGGLLQRVASFEGDPTDAAALPPGIDAETFSRLLAEAMAWANRID